MGIYIKGMEMPKGRPVCIVIDAAGQARRYDLNNDRYADDKLFEAVPVPAHGDLIDRDDFFATCPELVDRYKRITDDLVVIPAGESENKK